MSAAPAVTLSRADTVRLALSQVGVREEGTSNRQPYGVWYGWNGVYWCAIFVSWVLRTNPTGFRFASTLAAQAWAKKTGRWISVVDALPGDLVMKRYTDRTGHIGMVIARAVAGTVMSVEGNTGANDRDGGGVMTRNRSVSWWTGAIRIDYPSDSGAPSPTTPAPPTATVANHALAALQHLLGVPADGVWGPVTARAAAGHLLRRGANGDLVRWAQQQLVAATHRIAVDGAYGPDTTRQVAAYQAARHLTADGAVGPETYRSLAGA